MTQPYDSLSMPDAAVTIRSLPRRFTETVGGPVGDDSWDRTVRVRGSSGRSALGSVGRADAELVALGTAIASLPMERTPAVNLGPVDRKNFEPAAEVVIGEVLASLKENAGRAARAIEARGPNDFARTITLDGKSVPASDYVRRAIAATLGLLKDAQQAIDEALS